MPANIPRVALVARFWALAVTALQVVAPLLSEHWAWGVWPASYTPLPWRLGLALVAVVLILFGERIGGALATRARDHALRFDFGSPWMRLTIAAATAIPFYLFRIRHLHWGDAELLITALGDPYRITYVWQAPLDVFIHARLWQLGNQLFGWPDPTPVYRILSTLAGVAFVYVLLSLVLILGRDSSERWVAIGLVGTLGTMQLFFGYIENYPLMTAGILIYSWLGVRMLRGELSLAWPASVLAITHAFHPSTMVLIPSLFFLWWRGNSARKAGVLKDEDSWPKRLLSVAIPYAVVLAGVIALMEGGGHGITALATVDFPGGGDRQWFVPLFEITTEWQHYTMFSLGHLIDIANQQLLVAPVIWPMLLAVALMAWKSLPFGDSTFRFLSIMAGAYLLLTLTWNADYGGQKDWDLFSPAAVPAALLLAFVLPRAIESKRAFRAAGWALVAAQGYHTILWVLRNTIP